MPSIELTKAPGLLDLENDQRDWLTEFREESALPDDSGLADESAFPEESPRPGAESMFTVVEHRRPAPIILPEGREVVQATPTHGHGRRSVLRRVKRAFSPTVAALLVLYVAVVFMTAWIGIQRGAATRGADATIEGSAPGPTETGGPAND
jgi:hypothetical protein